MVRCEPLSGSRSWVPAEQQKQIFGFIGWKREDQQDAYWLKRPLFGRRARLGAMREVAAALADLAPP